MFTSKVATVDDLVRAAAQVVSDEGVRISTSRGSCHEVVGTSFELTQPRARLSRTLSRGRVFSALGELCWYLSGSNSTERIVPYVKAYEAEDEDGVIWGGYGPRFVSFDGHDQLRYVVEQLTQKPTSRQAVIQLFDHEDVGGAHKDVPCTCSLQYLLRDGRLSAITYMRSNDVHLGLPHDIFCFTMLQELFARSLKRNSAATTTSSAACTFTTNTRARSKPFWPKVCKPPTGRCRRCPRAIRGPT